MDNLESSAGGIERTSFRSARVGILIALAAFLAATAFWLAPIVQPTDYHAFADARRIFGIPNFWDVITNAPFLLAGIAGVAFLRGSGARCAFQSPREAWPYAAFFTGLALTGAGSAYYHLAPDNARLVWDRMPITFSLMSLVAALVAERIDVKAGLRLLVPLILLGLASVWWWHASAASGAENLRPYVHLQLGAVIVVLMLAALFPSRYTRGGDVYLIVALYGVAKLTEMLDGAIYAAGELLSGHSWKHLLAGAAAFAVLRMLRKREVR